jgi:glycosyltransferase involved in cell wall biosynthesis
MKRVFFIADFKDESERSIRLQSRMWVKGLIRAGCDVQRFSYRNILTQFNPFSGKHFRRFMPKFVKRHTDELLVNQIKAYCPHIVFIFGMKYLDTKTIQAIRSAAPGVLIVGRDEDPFPEKNPERLAIAAQCDVVVNSSAGVFLESYKKAGVPRCAFFPNICDPDIQYRYDVPDQWKADVIFTGKATHQRLGAAGDRFDLIERISKMPGGRVYGSFGVPRVEGLDYFYALSGARIVLSINIINDVPMYHSDRLINALACGAFVLAKRVPQTELLHQDGRHLRYFDTEEEFSDLADWYLKHESERQKIADAGMEYAHRDYNCETMAKHFIELIETGKCSAPWNLTI